MTEPDEHRRDSLDEWERSARGWGAQRARMQATAAPVSAWMLDALHLQPGHDVLELAAGPGDTGFMAAELIRPGGRLMCSDVSGRMLDLARERARELGVDNVQFRVLNAESLDISAAQLDAVLCRWAYMLLADPAAALRETRRVLRPGGRVALAAWDAPQANPWAWRATSVVVGQGLTPERDPGAPGMFAWSASGRIESELRDAGFGDVEVDTVDLSFEHPSFDAWWDSTRDLSAQFAALVESLNERQLDALRAGIAEELGEFCATDGSLSIPGRTHVAAAGA